MGVNLLCISKKMDALKLHGVNSWSWKPFIVLLSSFQQVIFMDADVLFFQPPEVIFNSPIYKKYGMLFWRDREWLARYDITIPQIKSDFERPSEQLRNTRLWKFGSSLHELDSGVVVYDKKQLGPFFSLLFTCGLNDGEMRTRIYKYFWCVGFLNFLLNKGETRKRFGWVPNYSMSHILFTLTMQVFLTLYL
jgi:hypothetical protein